MMIEIGPKQGVFKRISATVRLWFAKQQIASLQRRVREVEATLAESNKQYQDLCFEYNRRGEQLETISAMGVRVQADNSWFVDFALLMQNLAVDDLGDVQKALDEAKKKLRRRAA